MFDHFGPLSFSLIPTFLVVQFSGSITKFICPKCKHNGAVVDRLAMSGEDWGRFWNAQTHCYAFVVCESCGYTEVFALDVLEGRDNLGAFIEWMFPG